MKERNKDLLDTLNIVQGMFSAGEVEALGANPDAVKDRLGDRIYRGAVESFGAQPVEGIGRIERSQGASAVLVEGAEGRALEERVDWDKVDQILKDGLKPLRNLGSATGKRGDYYGIKGHSLKIRWGSRELTLDRWEPTYQYGKVKGRWGNADYIALSKVTPEKVAKWVKMVKESPTTKELRAREREDSKREQRGARSRFGVDSGGLMASMAEDVKVYPEPEADSTEYPCTDTHYAPGGKSDAESAMFFEDPGEAMEAYRAAKSLGLTSGEVCFDPTIDPKYGVGSYAVRFSPITMMGKVDLVRQVVEMNPVWRMVFIEDVGEMQEHNPFHDRNGQFASKGDLAQGGGSWSLRIGSRRGGGAVEKSKVSGGKKVGKGKSKRTELKKKKWKTGWTGDVCGRSAREVGKDVKCSESLSDRIEELRRLLDDA